MKIPYLVSVQKWWIAPEFKAGKRFKPDEYWPYFEDLNFLTNAEIGCEAPFLDRHYTARRKGEQGLMT